MCERELTTRTSDLTTYKIMWNSVISTPGARFMTGDAISFYLATTLEKFMVNSPLKFPLYNNIVFKPNNVDVKRNDLKNHP